MELNIEADQIAPSFHPIAQQTTDINYGIALMELPLWNQVSILSLQLPLQSNFTADQKENAQWGKVWQKFSKLISIVFWKNGER